MSGGLVAQLAPLAQAAGVLVEWTDAYGSRRTVAPEALRAILDALDLPCASDVQCRDSLARLVAENEGNVPPPLLTAEVGLPIKLPFGSWHGRRYRIELEAGGEIEGQLPSSPAQPLSLPAIHAMGYHVLTVGDARITLAVAPARCYSVDDAAAGNGDPAASAMPARPARLWGLAAQLYALRRDGDAGIGDFTALKQLAVSAARHGAAALAISPVHAMFTADRGRFSPYAPSSRLFLNALHIDPGAVLGDAALEAALLQAGVDRDQVRAHLEQPALLDWAAASALRIDLLRRLYRQFRERGQASGFDAFRAQGGTALADHARFEALHAAFGQGWRNWPAPYQDPRGAAVEQFAREHQDEVDFHAFLQWQAALGLDAAQQAARAAGMPIGLIADLAVGADTGGSQAWSRQREMINGLSIGAPPDQLNARGQNWGLGAFSPRAMQLHGYGAYLEMLRAAFAHAGGVRIDHVLGLARMWLVPNGASPEEGAYLRFPLPDMLRLVALESWRHRAIVIGEDLGTVPEGFDRQLERAGILGIRVLWFQRDRKHPDRFLPASAWSPHAMATTTTHDLPSVAGWWEGRDIDWRTRLDLLEHGVTEADEQRARSADRKALWDTFTAAGCASGDMPPAAAATAPINEAVAFLAATPAPLALLPLEDALGVAEQWNIPGTTDAHPNWRRRLQQPVQHLLDEAPVAARLAILNRTRPMNGEKQ